VSRDADIDRLYQRPLDEFTGARNALAKGAGKDSGAIRALTKPPLAAWAVNQLYWQDRRTWDSLIDAAENLRRVNKAVLAGRSGDVRAAGSAHDAAVRDALKATLAQLASAGHPLTDATRQAIVNTLRALPADETPGRLTRALQPGGFEMLAGMSVAAPARKDTKDTKGTKSTKERAQSKEDARALTQAREAAAAADRALKDAEQAVRRHEFEIARAVRDEERAGRALEQARAALDEAQRALATAERDQAGVESRRTEAESAAKNAASAVTGASRQADAAHAALKKIQGR
jgi:hypothetical protein